MLRLGGYLLTASNFNVDLIEQFINELTNTPSPLSPD